MKNKNNINPLKYNISKCFFIFMSFIKDKITVIHHLCSVYWHFRTWARKETNQQSSFWNFAFIRWWENDKKIHSGTLCRTTIQDNYSVINKIACSARMQALQNIKLELKILLNFLSYICNCDLLDTILVINN